MKERVKWNHYHPQEEPICPSSLVYQFLMVHHRLPCFQSLFLFFLPMGLSFYPTIFLYHFLFLSRCVCTSNPGVFTALHKCRSFHLISSCPSCYDLFCTISLHPSFHILPISQINLVNGPSLCATKQCNPLLKISHNHP